MKITTCCFAGHSQIYGQTELEQLVYNKCEELITDKKVVRFLVGNYGSFDSMATRVVNKLKLEYSCIELDLFIPYLTKEIEEYKEQYYQKYAVIIMADISPNTPPRLKILKCNQYMVDKSDYLIAYVNRTYGGAIKTLEYAKKQRVETFNFGNIL